MKHGKSASSVGDCTKIGVIYTGNYRIIVGENSVDVETNLAPVYTKIELAETKPAPAFEIK